MNGNTESIAASGAALYSLQTGGQLDYTTSSGTVLIDTSTDSFAVTPYGTLYDLDTGGKLTVWLGSSYLRTIDYDTQSIAVDPVNGFYNLLEGGLLEYSDSYGTSWSYPYGTQVVIQAFSVATNGDLYALESGDVLTCFPYQSSTVQTIDNYAQSFAVSPNGTLYDLDNDGVLQYWPSPNASSVNIDSALHNSVALTFAMAPDGLIYALDSATIANNITYSTPSLWCWANGNWVLVDSTAQSFAMTGNGMVIDLDTNQALNDFVHSWSSSSFKYTFNFQNVGNYSKSFAVNGNGTVFSFIPDQNSLNGLYRVDLLGSSTIATAVWAQVAPGAQGFNLTPNGTLEVQAANNSPLVSTDSGNDFSNFFSTMLPDSEIAADAEADYTASSEVFTRADMLDVFHEVQMQEEISGTLVITAAEYTTLQALVDSYAIYMPDYVRNLAGKVINGSPVNDTFNGTVEIGELGPNWPSSQLEELVETWFYGAYLPVTGNDPNTNLSFPYEPASGSLYGSSGTPLDTDIAQGRANDCYFMTALGQIALQSPKTIENMFINNQDGTYTVRFFNNGVADYVTVNNELPIWSDNTSNNNMFAYAGYDQNGQYGQPNYYYSSTNVLWVGLAEKAYAQLVAEGWSRADYGYFTSAYPSISVGYADEAMNQITGSTIRTNIFINGTTTGTALSTAESQVEAALSKNEFVTLGTPDSLPNNGYGAYQGWFNTDHDYMILSYSFNAVLDQDVFTFVNPYQTGAGSYLVKSVTWAELVTLVSANSANDPLYFSISVPAPGDIVSSVES